MYFCVVACVTTPPERSGRYRTYVFLSFCLSLSLYIYIYRYVYIYIYTYITYTYTPKPPEIRHVFSRCFQASSFSVLYSIV